MEGWLRWEITCHASMRTWGWPTESMHKAVEQHPKLSCDPHMRTHTNTCTHAYTHKHMYTCMQYSNAYIHICCCWVLSASDIYLIHIGKHKYTHAHMRMYTFRHIHLIHAHMHTYAHTRIHTGTHATNTCIHTYIYSHACTYTYSKIEITKYIAILINYL